MLVDFFDQQKNFKLHSQPPTTPLPANNMSTPSTKKSQTAEQILVDAARLDLVIRAALGPGGDIQATMAKMSSNLVSQTTQA